MNVEELNKSQNVISKEQLKNILGGGVSYRKVASDSDVLSGSGCGWNNCESCDGGCQDSCKNSSKTGK
jgi:hypothetical protein